MKKFIITSILAALVALGTTVMAQDYPDEYLGLPGDNLNLYAVMKLFQESETLEGFERSLNDENSRINNLDLNGDNLIDYIMVQDYVDGDVHTIVLRVELNRNETQDVAVFTVQRFRNGSVQIQLIGDEALYGRNYIVEPIYDETQNPGYTGRPVNRENITVVRTTYYEVAAWPLIRFIFLPNYVMWHSSWYWGYYPSYWHPWRPYYWHYYYGYHYNWYPHYYSHYHHWQHHRYTRYNDFYYSGIRAHSPMVSNRIKEGGYRNTYSRPEQRRDGEALYTKLNPGQNTRAQDNTAINSQGRRSVSQPTREQTSAGTSSGTPRRSTTTVNDRPVTKSSAGQNTNASRRSTTTVNNRPVTKSSAGQNTDASRRSSATATNRPVSQASSGQNADASRRSTPAVSNRTASRPEPVQRSETARTSRPSTPRASSSGQRSSRESKAGTDTRKRENAKGSANEKSSRSR
ncbi:MAG: hypothetical protein MUO72_03400 [Bacteroidales bacterium]|nr:hypothetical protein [Bacteroidales bacterium]